MKQFLAAAGGLIENLEIETSTNTNLIRCVWVHMLVKHGFSYYWKMIHDRGCTEEGLDNTQIQGRKYEEGAQNFIVRNFNKMDGTCGTQATLGNECRILVLKTEGKRPVMTRLMWEDNFNRPHTNRVKVWIKQHWLITAVGCTNFGFRNNRY